MPDDWQSKTNTVDLFAINLTRPPITFDHSMGWLDPTESQRVERFKSPIRQREFAITRAMLRRVLAWVLRIQPQAVCFEHNAQGKPFLPENTVFFNVSHSHEVALIAISLDAPLGVDIEHIHPRENYLKLARRFFAPGEYQALIALPENIQLKAFHTIWTRKEAFVKANAKGIALGLDQFQVNVDPDTPAKLEINHPDITQTWTLCDLIPPDDDYAACLCLTTSMSSCRCWQMCPA